MKHITECINFLENIKINEAVSSADFEKAKQICKKFFTKYGIGVMSDIEDLAVDNVNYYSSFVYSMSTDLGCSLLWKSSDGESEIDGLVFYKGITEVLFKIGEGEKASSECGINTSGISLTKLIPLIKDVVLGKIPMNKKGLEKALEGYSLDENFLDELGELINEDIADLRSKREKLAHRIRYAKQKGGDISALEKELEDIIAQINNQRVSGPAAVNTDPDPAIEKLEDEFEERASPEERFADMEAYVKMVCNGVQPSLVVCGAPGVGKSYRILKLVEKRHTLGEDYFLVKGKLTPQKLFQILFEYHEEGSIIVLDDADDIIKDETSINILKAATDSGDKRIITYGTSRPPVADEDLVMLHPGWPWGSYTVGAKTVATYPVSFEFKGSVIIISNMRAGMIDTALRNRAFVCDLEFTVDELLGILRDLLPIIMPGKLGNEAKLKAFEFLQDLAGKGQNMEISIRSFITCAKIYEDLPPSEEKSAQRRIAEQMKNQFARGGKRY